MSNCTCGGTRTAQVSAKCDDRCNTRIRQGDYYFDVHDGVPAGLGIGNNDYVQFTLCLDCGRVLHPTAFPVHPEIIESLRG